MELVDVGDSKSPGSDAVPVRVRPGARRTSSETEAFFYPFPCLRFRLLLHSGRMRAASDKHGIIVFELKETADMEQLEFKFDTQLLIDGQDLDEDVIHDYILEHFKGDCLLVVGDDTLIKIHFHTNEPWKVLEYGQSIGDIYDVVVENMQRQEEGLKG